MLLWILLAALFLLSTHIAVAVAASSRSLAAAQWRQLLHHKLRSSREAILDIPLSLCDSAPIADASATATAAAIAGGRLTATAAVAAAVVRARWAADATGAVTDECFLDALLRACSFDEYQAATGRTVGPFLRVPITVADAIGVVGMDSTLGQARRCFAPAPVDAPSVAALRAAGAVVVAKSNDAGGGLSPATGVPPTWGAAASPWAPDRLAATVPRPCVRRTTRNVM
ncbi:hypothetical protein I4F81_004780 [Pyropia yezoensis]|uniref:Uncharacterized protein n=1 Tax=Pyropia yezoensis TaxID=2788 RepID=A0ACC3BWT5_PYRYE|nr:hypothetical protein I4F81_004780 [Neopyropia yezoensis]|eukprot:contig_12119_g2899